MLRFSPVNIAGRRRRRTRLREIRLQRVRKQLLAAGEQTSVTAVALENGFLPLPRFSGYYRAAFGESPVATLQRNRRNVAPIT
ncbi:MAG: helix-turn-helix domain-containing protein [Steroidobacteraceae bacterium]